VNPSVTMLAGMRKAAVLLVLLGEDVASQIYRNLPQQDLEQLTKEIAELDYVDPQTALAVLEEYHRMAAEKLRALSRSARILTSGRTGATTVAAALRPWHGPATANAKRLRRN